MTGQMLAGDDATVAAKYQIMIMYAVAAVSACSCLAVTMAAAGVLLDSQHRLRLDRLSLRVSTRDTISELAKYALPPLPEATALLESISDTRCPLIMSLVRRLQALPKAASSEHCAHLHSGALFCYIFVRCVGATITVDCPVTAWRGMA